jgi:hypothetical protein
MTSGDMVEEMARAIRAAIDASDHLAAGPRDVGEEYHGEPRTLLYVDGAFDLDAVAQAAATIAKGRVAELASKVEIAAVIFEEYGRLHRKKETADGNLKAERNEQYAAEMRAALKDVG